MVCGLSTYTSNPQQGFCCQLPGNALLSGGSHTVRTLLSGALRQVGVPGKDEYSGRGAWSAPSRIAADDTYRKHTQQYAKHDGYVGNK